MAENKPEDGTDSSESVAQTSDELVSSSTSTTTSDDPVDPLNEPGKPVPPRPPGTEPTA